MVNDVLTPVERIHPTDTGSCESMMRSVLAEKTRTVLAGTASLSGVPIRPSSDGVMVIVVGVAPVFMTHTLDGPLIALRPGTSH